MVENDAQEPNDSDWCVYSQNHTTVMLNIQNRSSEEQNSDNSTKQK